MWTWRKMPLIASTARGMRWCVLALFLSAIVALAACGSNASAQNTSQTLTQQAGTLTVTMLITPAKFGQNTFTATVKNPDGSALTGGNVSITTAMVEMDMGTQVLPLAPASTPGAYTGRGELTMAGHWRLTMDIRTAQNPGQVDKATFTIDIGY